MEIILFTTLVALLYYLAILFAANRFILKKYKSKHGLPEGILPFTVQMLFAVNINIMCCLLLTHDSLMDYMTYLMGDDPGAIRYFSSGAVIFLINVVVLYLSFWLSRLLMGLLGSNTPIFVKPIIWVAINLVLIKLTSLYYEAYLGTNNFTIL